MIDEAADQDWGGRKIQEMLLETDYRIDHCPIASCGDERRPRPKPCETKRCSAFHIEM